MPRQAETATRLGRALTVADRRAAILPLRDAFAQELHRSLPDDIPNRTIDDLARRLTGIALFNVGTALVAAGRDA